MKETSKNQLNYIFNSTKGLILLVAIAMIGVVAAVWGMLSGPMAEKFGVREVVVRLLGMDMVEFNAKGASSFSITRSRWRWLLSKFTSSHQPA